MKTIYHKIAVACISLLLVASCKDVFNDDDLKTNPNEPSESQITLTPLTTGTLVGLGALHEDTDTRIAFMWGGQLAGQSRQHAGFQNYTVAASSFSWTTYYNVLKNARLINKKAASINNKRSVGLSQVVEAMVMLKLTSLWGDVPYSEAVDETTHPTPKYDGQLVIYSSLLALLDNAYANLKSGVGSISGDFIYDGNSLKWAAAAKSLQSRIYLHLKDYPNAIAAANLGIGNAADDMLMTHGTSLNIDVNLNFDFFDNSRPGDTSFDPPAYLPVFMCTNLNTGVFTVDVAKRNTKTDETGMYFHFFQYGAESAGGLDPNTADGMFVNNAPHPLLTYYETQLIIAEASARLSSPNYTTSLAALNNVRAGLATGYINGLTSIYSPLVYAPYVDADFDPNGIANPTTGPNAGKTKQQALLYEIASQKFVVMLAQYEVFNDLRRLQTATPIISLGIPISNGTRYPARFIYPQNEINTNPNTPNPAPDQFVKLPVFQ